MKKHLASLIIIFSSWTASAADNANSPTFKLSGDVSLLSHFVENGLSQTDNSPALQGSFWFNFGPQFRLGLWGSNTNYQHSDDNFNLRALAEVSVHFSPSSHLRILYSHNRYYNAGDRNGSILGVHLSFFSDYHASFEAISNWEGTDAKANRLAMGHKKQVFGKWLWTNELGYNSVDAASIKSYFDGRTALGTYWGVIFFEGALTATSESSQFHGDGDLFFILSAKTEF